MKINVRLAFISLSFGVSTLVAGCAGSSNNSSSTPPTTTPTVVAPTVSSVSPTAVAAGSAETDIAVTGTGFTSSTVVQIGGSFESTTFVSSTQVTAALPATQLLQGGLLSVIAVNGTASSGSGTAVNLTVNNPAPVITQFLPASFATGSAATTVAVSGTGFVPSTTIQVGGNARPTIYIGPAQVDVSLTATDLATSGSLSLTAVNPAPGGGTSSAASIAINNPAPGAITLSPATVFTGSTTVATVTVTGTGFLASSVVQLNGTAQPTTYVSATQLTFQLTVADQAAATVFMAVVVNTSPGGGASPAAALTVTAPTPTPVLSAVTPNQVVVGSGDTVIQVIGTNLAQGDIVQWNGAPLNTNFSPYYYNNGPTLFANVPASLLATIGTASITVDSPSSPTPVSNALTVTIVNPPAPTLTSISPSVGPTNTATTVSLYGTGFTTASTVTFNGNSVTATFGNSTALTVALLASSVALPGNGSFVVTTPGPGGGTTAPIVYTAYIGLINNSMVYNPVNGLLYVSVPSSMPAPYGNAIVSVDPETGALGTPIPVGSEPNKLALSSDGTILWVGLDGASAVRQVNLATNTAGLQFSIGGNSGTYNSPGTAVALAALPGSPNSVVVSTSTNVFNLTLAIYDNGIVRGTPANTNGTYGPAYGLQVDGTRNEVYAAGSSYYTYSYGASGLTLLASSAVGANFASSTADEIDVAGGRLYTDFGQVFDAETGSLLGSLYSAGSTFATGPTVVDPTLGRIFVLDSLPSSPYGSYSQIQAFNTSDFNLASASTVPVSIASGTYNYNSAAASRLTRWGTNGLAFRTPIGIYSLRSNVVKDLSTTSTDLSVTLADTGAATTGASTTYTATVTNAGPADATNVAFTATIPASSGLASVTSSAGACSTSNGIACDLGGLANGASVTLTIVAQQTTSGSAVLTAQVSGSETDPNLVNNQAVSTIAVTGNAYNLPPAISAISPSTIVSGSADTVVTVSGSGFTSASTVQLGGAALATNFTSTTTLTATVPAAQLANLGWAPLAVSTPAPGGGTSAALPLTVYSVVNLAANHILYDPYSRNLMASVSSDSTAITGNSIVAVTPDTAAVGTPVAIGSQPTNLALTSDGQILYTILSGSQSVARFNMLTQQPDYTYVVPNNLNFTGAIALRGVSAQPGTENTIALDISDFSGNAIFDFDPATKTASIRGHATGPYTGSCIQFLDSSDLLGFNTDIGSTFTHSTIDASGFASTTASTLNRFSCFKLSGGTAFAVSGGVANPAPAVAVQLGVFPVNSPYYSFNGGGVEPDASLQRAFYAVNSTTIYSGNVDSIQSFDVNTFLPIGVIPLDFTTVEGVNTPFTLVDLVRWGQDGLAALTNSGHLYLLRGAAIVPGELATNTAATITASSSTTVGHGSGNTVLTLTGTNFLPGVAVNLNGSYRTTTIVDSTHVTVAIPASDLTVAGSVSLTAVNPGAPASGALTITIN